MAGDSRLVPLQIDDGDDRGKVYQRKAKASAAPLPAWLVGPPPAAPSEAVVVQSNRAWIGARRLAVCPCISWSEPRSPLSWTAGNLTVESCRLEFTNDKCVAARRVWSSLLKARDACCYFRVSLWARCFDGDEIHYTELLCEGIVTKWLSGYQRTDESQWPVRKALVVLLCCWCLLRLQLI